MLKEMEQGISIMWFRRDLRLEDNMALYYAHKSGLPVLALFIFDNQIISHLDVNDARIDFIYQNLRKIYFSIRKDKGDLYVHKGRVIDIFNHLSGRFHIQAIYANADHEQYGIIRDQEVTAWAEKRNISFVTFHDHMVHWPGTVVKSDEGPYTVFTPFSKKWKTILSMDKLFDYTLNHESINWANIKEESDFPTLKSFGFYGSNYEFPAGSINDSLIASYDKTRDIPGIKGTSRLGVHLRFGTISIRKLVRKSLELNDVFFNELIWREFYMHILFFFPNVEKQSFKKQYERMAWVNDENLFKKWCSGQTGYPMVDAGMRELNETGFMHNRLRMITAGFLTKILLIDWRWGERYFAEKLLDYELSSNNGGWQWSAGTGADAVPYFRIFNPESQQKKHDKEFKYIKTWIPEYEASSYIKPIVEYNINRKKCLTMFASLNTKV